MTPSSPPIGLALILAGVLFPVRASAQAPCEVFRLENPMAPVDGHFGHAVALRDGRLVVGMPSFSTPPGVMSTGTAYVFDQGAAGWTLTAELPFPDAQEGALFGHAVAVDGDVVLVTRRDDGLLGSKGSVYVFQREASGQWVQTQKLVPPDPEAWAFGWSLTLQGTRAVIGSKGAGSVGPKGRVYVYELEDGQLVQKAKLIPSLDNLSDWFGASVALDGDRIAVGANKGGTGRAYVFDRQPSGEWVEQALLLPDDLAHADEYGYAVAVRGDRIAVSARLHDIPWGNGGAVYLFELGEGGWEQVDKLSSQKKFGSNPRFGYSLHLEDDELLVGSPTCAEVITSAGAVYVFRREGSTWTEVAKLYGSSPGLSAWFGAALARDDQDLAVGAPAAPSATPGRVHLFSYEGGAQLAAESESVSVAGGGRQVFQLGACPQHAGDFYLLLGSLSGTEPGLDLGPALLPLVPDAYFLFSFENPNSPVLQSTLGTLDPWGRAKALFTLPPATLSPSAAGLVAHHAYLVLDAQTLAVELASNPTPLFLVP